MLQEASQRKQEASNDKNHENNLEEMFSKNMSKGVDWLKESGDHLNGSLSEQMNQFKQQTRTSSNAPVSNGGNDGGDGELWSMLGKRFSQVGLGLAELAVKRPHKCLSLLTRI